MGDTDYMYMCPAVNVYIIIIIILLFIHEM